MEIKKYIYNGHVIELHEHPIYHDFEYVVKTLDNQQIKGTSTIPYAYANDAEKAAQILINSL